MAKNSFKKLAAIAILISAAFVFIIASVFLPLANSVSGALSELKTQENFLSEIDRHQRQLSSLKDNWTRNQEGLKIISERIISEDKIVEAVILMEDLSERIGVDQDVSVLQSPKGGAGSDSIFLKDSVSGEFKNIAQYIQGIENLKYLIEVDSCDLIAEKDFIKAEFILKIPVYKE